MASYDMASNIRQAHCLCGHAIDTHFKPSVLELNGIS